MKKQDFFFSVIAGVSIFMLFQFFSSFTVTNLIAIINHKQIFAYVALTVSLLGIVFIFRNLGRAVWYVSGSFDEPQRARLIHDMAIDTLFMFICFTLLSVTNVYMFYFFNYLGL